jgi:cohesin complex subunit SA-1/2
MDQVLAQAKLEVSATAKAWEPQRAYEKRLTAVISKDKRMPLLLVDHPRRLIFIYLAQAAKRRGGKATKSADVISGDENASDGEGLIAEPENEDAPPRRRSSRTRSGGPPAEPGQTEDEAGPEPITPKPRPRPKPVRKTTPPEEFSLPKSPEPAESLRAKSVGSEAGVNGFDNPKVSRKRGRSKEDEEEPVMNEGAPAADDPPADSLTNPPTPPGDIQIRRKRVRH